VRPTRPGVLLAVAALAGLFAYLIAELDYGAVPALPGGAPVTLVMVAAAELVLAKVVRDRVLHRPTRDGRPPRRPLHPMQVARCAALAKASSPAGALLAGLYGGLFLWTAPRADVLAAASQDALVSGLSALAAGSLVVAALVLERACRVPTPPDEPDSGTGLSPGRD
jgi:hypothetical protein